MILFFDTSALVKFFHREEGTDVVTSLITDPGNRVWVSELARLEFGCALHRRFRMKEIDEDQLMRALDGFSSEFSRFNTRKIGSAVLDEAETLVNRLGKSVGLRALDAIHLATFSLFNQLEEMPFVATDEILLSAARSIRAKVKKPRASERGILAFSRNRSSSWPGNHFPVKPPRNKLTERIGDDSMAKLDRKNKSAYLGKQLPSESGSRFSRRLQFGQHLPENIPMFSCITLRLLCLLKLR